jgi:hypothetical protein
VAGYVAARWGLAGPVACVASRRAGLAVAELLVADGDATSALIVHCEQTESPPFAHAILLEGR